MNGLICVEKQVQDLGHAFADVSMTARGDDEDDCAEGTWRMNRAADQERKLGIARTDMNTLDLRIRLWDKVEQILSRVTTLVKEAGGLLLHTGSEWPDKL